MKVTFWGAAREVTGSRHLVQANGTTLLLDCGLFQGHREEAEAKNRRFGFDPARVDAVVLSHAHIDHSGALPALGRNGFKGPVHCTPATADLCGAMLMDSAHIQEKDAEFVNRSEERRGARRRAVEPLYDAADVEALLKRLQPHNYEAPFKVADGIEAVYRDAGHMLGSANVELRVTERGVLRRLAFSGDLGRRLLPVLRDPVQIDGADDLILESTYGNTSHPPVDQVAGELLAFLQPIIARRGKVIVPAFAVGRTQEIVYVLTGLLRSGRLPHVPVYIDSPLAVEVTGIFNRHPECYDEEMRKILAGPGDPFGFKTLRYVRSVEESKALNGQPGPCVIISASGMAETGRVLHHLRNTIGDPANAVLLVGFQAEHTLGRRLQELAPVVRIFGEPVERRAEVHFMHAFSGHGDKDDLFAFATGIQHPRPGRVILVHGEPEQQNPLAERLRREGGFREVVIPARGDTVDLG